MEKYNKLALAVALASGLSACGSSTKDSTPNTDDTLAYKVQSVPSDFTVNVPESLKTNEDESSRLIKRKMLKKSFSKNATTDSSSETDGSDSLAYQEVQSLASEIELQNMQVELALLMIDTSFETLESECSSTSEGQECRIASSKLSVEFTPEILTALKQIDDKYGETWGYEDAWGYSYAANYNEYCESREPCVLEEDYEQFGRFAEFVSRTTKLGDITFIEYAAGEEFAYSVSISNPGVWNSNFQDTITAKWSEDKKTIRVIYHDTESGEESYSSSSTYDYTENDQGLNSVRVTQTGSYEDEGETYSWAETLQLSERSANGESVDVSYTSRADEPNYSYEYKVSGTADENGGELTTKHSGTYEYDEGIENYSYSYSEKFNAEGKLESYAYCNEESKCTENSDWEFFKYDDESDSIIVDDDVDESDYEYYYAQVEIEGIELNITEDSGSFYLCVNNSNNDFSWDNCVGYGYIESYEGVSFEDFYLHTEGFEDQLGQIKIYRDIINSDGEYEGIEEVVGASVSRIIEDFEDYFTSEFSLPETATPITSLQELNGTWRNTSYEEFNVYVQFDDAGNWTTYFGLDIVGCYYSESGTAEYKTGGYVKLDEYSDWSQTYLDGDASYSVYNYDGYDYVEAPFSRLNELPNDITNSICSDGILEDIFDYEADDESEDESNDYPEQGNVKNLTEVEGVWDYNYTYDGVKDVFYLAISDGKIAEYDFMGDDYDQGDSCYWSLEDNSVTTEEDGIFESDFLGEFALNLNEDGSLQINYEYYDSETLTATNLNETSLSPDCAESIF